MTNYSFEEILKNILPYFKNDELAAKTWIGKYALKDSLGNIYENHPDQMHRRLAKELARIENNYPNPLTEEQIFDLIKDFRYLVPQGGPMSGIGNNFQFSSISNCFVVGDENDDSYGGILRVDQEQVQLMKRRAGVGHDLSHLRPKGAPTKNSALVSTGAPSFMHRYSESTREVAQDGRRGALMLSISVKHPDSEEFIDEKMKPGKITGANVSVRIDNEFMRSIIDKKDYIQTYPIQEKIHYEYTNELKYNILYPFPEILKTKNTKLKYIKKVKALDIWNKIVHNAWKSAEPGILFWDKIIDESPADCYANEGYKTISTNPCGEIPLCPYDSCRLLAINLYSYVEKPFTSNAKFNWDLFKTHAQIAQRLMDDIVDIELEKIQLIIDKIKKDPESELTKAIELNIWQQIHKKAKNGRRTGLGITAEGDMLAALGFKYGTKKATDFAVEVHTTLAIEAYASSIIMADERGPFPIWNNKKEEKNPFLNRIKVWFKKYNYAYSEFGAFDIAMEKLGRRNISLLTIAPTGTTSLMTQTTSGIEPVFLPVYKRRKKVNPNDDNVKVNYIDEQGDSWEEYNVFHHKFVEYYSIKCPELGGYDNTLKFLNGYSDKALEGIIKESPYYKATSADVDWKEKVRMQGEVQRWVDHSISVTINLPEDATEKLVSELYILAWKSGCKGVTVYRDGSREGVLISNKPKEGNNNETRAKKRPPLLDCQVLRFQINKERWIAFVGVKDERPYEIFTGKIDEKIAAMPQSPNHIGKIMKNYNKEGMSRYDFIGKDYSGEILIIEGISHSFNREFHNYAKLVSGILRHGMPIQHVVRIVEKMEMEIEGINSWKAGVVRALTPFIKNGIQAVKAKCEECGSNNLVFEEGCLKCTQCGSSKCG